MNLQEQIEKPTPELRMFHGQRTSNGVRKFEMPWHRTAAHLIASGRSQKDTAKILDVEVTSVNQLFRTPWFQDMVLKLMEENGHKDLMALFKAELLNAHNVLVELRDNPQVSPAVRANIARDMIERIYGKPTQRIESSETANIADPVAEAARLEAENARLRGASKN